MKAKMNLPVEVEISYIRVNAYIPFWEDAYVNGVADDNDSPTIPCASSCNCYWQPLIEIETGQVLNWQKGVSAETNYKVRDRFKCDFLDEKNETVKSFRGYVPEFMYPGKNGWEDYIMLNINEEGYIERWDKNLVEEFLNL